MARGLTASGSTGSATASGGTASLHITGLPNAFNITKLKVVPSAGSGQSNAEIFSKDSLSGSDLRGKWKSVLGNVYEPMDFSSGTPAEGPAAIFVSVYEDEDATGELHLKVTNNDTVDKSYAVNVTYEEVPVFDASRVMTIQKLELLGDLAYFGGRTNSHVSVSRSGLVLSINQAGGGGLADLAIRHLTVEGVTSSGATGSANVVFSNSPTLVTPNIGTPSAGVLTNCTGLPVSTGISGLGSNVATFLATPSSANLRSALTDETGSGAAVFADSPTLVTPNLGTPSAGVLTNCTSLPISTGVSGLGSGVATFLATPSSANLAAAVTGETGSGALVFATSPALVTPNIGAASGTSLNLSGDVTANKAFLAELDVSSAVFLSGNGVKLNISTAGVTKFRNAADNADTDIECGSLTASSVAGGSISGSLSQGGQAFNPVTLNYLDHSSSPQSIDVWQVV